ncbi:hypothetical protein [Hugenholtzia roseola]|uniref:hypothetical protein n=1 Tax=Hugenholtzia roseola TaxID=1002 RepID=UPI000422B985|nr:hypothetical protein [Hugenholtzia roseola]
MKLKDAALFLALASVVWLFTDIIRLLQMAWSYFNHQYLFTIDAFVALFSSILHLIVPIALFLVAAALRNSRLAKDE